MDETVLQSYLRGESNDEQCRQVEEWSEESPENRKTLEQLYYTLFVGERSAIINAIDTETSLERFKSTLLCKKRKSRQKGLSVRWGRFVALAAAFFTGLVIAGGIGWGLLSNKLADYTILTNAGQRAQTVLPDGSKVWLNSSTKVVYRNSFWSSERQVQLTGEAYFEVSHDEHAPFIVNSKQIKTSVLGTKFDVRARLGENRVVTTLLQGSVRVESPKTEDDGYLLKPGQTLCVNTDNYQAELIEYNKPADILLWIDGRLEFKEYSLQEITDIMAKLYDVQFIYDDITLKSERFTGKFSTDNTQDEILNVLSHTNYFKYMKEGRTIRLSRR